MRKTGTAVMLSIVVFLLMSLASAANATTRHPCAPDAKAFTKEVGYKSLAGDLRLRVHQNTGVWMTREQLNDCYVLQPFAPVNSWSPGDLGPSIEAIRYLKPFSAQTNYMSVRGYLRWLGMASASA